MNAAVSQRSCGAANGLARAYLPSCVPFPRGQAPSLPLHTSPQERAHVSLSSSTVPTHSASISTRCMSQERSGGTVSTSYSSNTGSATQTCYSPNTNFRRPRLGRVTPSKLAAISGMLQMPLKMVQTLVDRNPMLMSVESDDLQCRMQALGESLALKPREIIRMVSKQPMLLFPDGSPLSWSIRVAERSISNNSSSSSSSNSRSGPLINGWDGSSDSSSSSNRSSNKSINGVNSGIKSSGSGSSRSNNSINVSSSSRGVGSKSISSISGSSSDKSPSNKTFDGSDSTGGSSRSGGRHRNSTSSTRNGHSVLNGAECDDGVEAVGSSTSDDGASDAAAPSRLPARKQAELLAHELGVAVSEVLRWAVTAPSILSRSRPECVVWKVQRFAEIYCVDEANAGRIVCGAPQHLTDSYSSVERRLQALCCLTGKDRRTVARMVGLRPDLMFVSSRILVNKFHVLQGIFRKTRRHVVTLILTCPSLLQADLPQLQSLYFWLPRILGKQQGFVYAMVCHKPDLLLLPPTYFVSRLQRLRHAFSTNRSWEVEWRKLSPARLAICLTRTIITYTRLNFVSARQQEYSSTPQAQVPGLQQGQQGTSGSSQASSQRLTQGSTQSNCRGGTKGSMQSSKTSLVQVLLSRRDIFDEAWPGYSKVRASQQAAAAVAGAGGRPATGMQPASPAWGLPPHMQADNNASLAGGSRPAGMSMVQWQLQRRRARQERHQQQVAELQHQRWQMRSQQLDSMLYHEGWQGSAQQRWQQQQDYTELEEDKYSDLVNDSVAAPVTGSSSWRSWLSGTQRSHRHHQQQQENTGTWVDDGGAPPGSMHQHGRTHSRQQRLQRQQQRQPLKGQLNEHGFAGCKEDDTPGLEGYRGAQQAAPVSDIRGTPLGGMAQPSLQQPQQQLQQRRSHEQDCAALEEGESIEQGTALNRVTHLSPQQYLQQPPLLPPQQQQQGEDHLGSNEALHGLQDTRSDAHSLGVSNGYVFDAETASHAAAELDTISRQGCICGPTGTHSTH